MTKSINKSKGFTIVELLVVIVVIAILAAISIVSYTGVTKTAKANAAATNADQVASAANAYNSEKGFFPALGSINSGTYVKLSNLTPIAGGAAVLSGATGDENKILYQLVSTTGACIGYWDFANSTMAHKYVGTATAGSLNIASPTCS